MMANNGEEKNDHKADHKSGDYKNLEDDLNELYLKGLYFPLLYPLPYLFFCFFF
jgi:hypothetical protein